MIDSDNDLNVSPRCTFELDGGGEGGKGDRWPEDPGGFGRRLCAPSGVLGRDPGLASGEGCAGCEGDVKAADVAEAMS